MLSRPWTHLNSRRPGWRRQVAAVLTMAVAMTVLCAALTLQLARAAEPLSGPSFDVPASGQSLSYSSPLVFRVQPVDGASGYLWGFFQQDEPVWENYANERVLSGTEYRIDPGTPAHEAIQPGPLQVWVRGLVDGEWTDATILNVTVAQAQSGSGSCPAITFYGLRGSGEPAYPGEENMGTLAADTYAQFVSRANYAGVKVIPDGVPDYPAAPFLDLIKEDLVVEATRKVLLQQAFYSVQQGAASLGKRVAAARAADPAMCFVFTGYSQGSWVIGEFLARPAGKSLVESGRIEGIVLYADPLFDPAYDEAIGDRQPGIARALNLHEGGDTPYVPDRLRGKVRSYCLSNDIVCNFRWASLPDAAKDISDAAGDIRNLSCLSADPTRLFWFFCPHHDYRYSVFHLPMSDEGASFLGGLILGLP